MKLDTGILALFGNIFLWGIGGWLITRRLFILKQRERFLLGFAIGMVIQNFLVNLLAQIIDLSNAIWISSSVVFFIGVIISRPYRWQDLWAELKQAMPQLIWVLALTTIFFLTGCGLAIFDDYQNLPVTSLLATGEIPPRFALDPDLHFGYHYFLLLEAAQVMRIGQIYPWNALDLIRSLVLALTLTLSSLWAWRLTYSRLVGMATAFFVVFSSGVRWVLLFFPKASLEKISDQVQMMGSGAQTADTLFSALTTFWRIEGSGPIPFPFAFSNGVHSPLIMSLGGFGSFPVMIVVILLLTGSLRKHWGAGVVLTIMLAALALSNEVLFGLLVGGALVVFIVTLVQKRAVPPSMLRWIIVALAAGLLALVQGGMLTETARVWLTQMQGIQNTSYYSVQFRFSWPPVLVSSHLGLLHLSKPKQLLVALLEIGPAAFILWAVFRYGWREAGRNRWFNAVFAATALFSLLMLFFTYSGEAGISATGRLYAGFLLAADLFVVPFTWVWIKYKADGFKAAALLAGFIAVLSGVILFAVQVIAIPKPVYSYFLRDLDVIVQKHYWNKLEPEAIIFDASPVRAVTVFGRYSQSHKTWYETRDDWQTMLENPDPYVLNTVGFDYIYLDIDYWDGLDRESQGSLAKPCVRQVDEFEGYRNPPVDYGKDFRRILDISDCH